MYFRVQLLFFLLCCLIGRPATAHEFNFGLFEIFREDQSLFMQIRLDEDKLALALNERFDLNTKGGFDTEWQCYITDYLEEKMDLKIEEKPVDFEFLTFDSDQKTVTILTEIHNPPGEISRVRVTNTVLLEIEENQTNLIKSSLHGRSRSFRLNRERTSTLIKY